MFPLFDNLCVMAEKTLFQLMYTLETSPRYLLKTLRRLFQYRLP